jgi:hypothetical protein
MDTQVVVPSETECEIYVPPTLLTLASANADQIGSFIVW